MTNFEKIKQEISKANIDDLIASEYTHTFNLCCKIIENYGVCLDTYCIDCKRKYLESEALEND